MYFHRFRIGWDSIWGTSTKSCRAVLTFRHKDRQHSLVCISIHGTTYASHKPFLESAALWNSAVRLGLVSVKGLVHCIQHFTGGEEAKIGNVRGLEL